MYYPCRLDFSETSTLQQNLGKIIIFWSHSPLEEQFHMQALAPWHYFLAEQLTANDRIVYLYYNTDNFSS